MMSGTNGTTSLSPRSPPPARRAMVTDYLSNAIPENFAFLHAEFRLARGYVRPCDRRQKEIY
jgi:hypothetical protein